MEKENKFMLHVGYCVSNKKNVRFSPHNVSHNLQLLVGILYGNPDSGLLGKIILLIITSLSFLTFCLVLAAEPVSR